MIYGNSQPTTAMQSKPIGHADSYCSHTLCCYCYCCTLLELSLHSLVLQSRPSIWWPPVHLQPCCHWLARLLTGDTHCGRVACCAVVCLAHLTPCVLLLLPFPINQNWASHHGVRCIPRLSWCLSSPQCRQLMGCTRSGLLLPSIPRCCHACCC